MRKQRWDSYSKGEELFGLPVTKYEGLEKTETEIQMLDRLYSYGPAAFALVGSLLQAHDCQPHLSLRT